MEAGDFEDARGVLTDFAADFVDKTKVYPLIYAALSYCAAQLGDKTEALSMRSAVRRPAVITASHTVWRIS